jgi:glucan-binding YG repeat protein
MRKSKNSKVITEQQAQEKILNIIDQQPQEQTKETTPASKQPATQQAADNKKVQLQEQAPENAADGKIVETKKPETSKKKQIEPAIQKMFDKMIAFMVDKGCTTKETPAYTGLKCGKHNIAEIYLQKKGIRLHLNSQSLSAENIDHCKVVPDTYGWTLDSVYKVTDEQSYNIAIEMLEQGFNFRNKGIDING